ncbi:MAG: SDR family NAD(P)-dependent oxidoreductase [Calditrichaceae bacterium]|nr:SDR family NAD(P)-dependent oxidoreductase [Calditrichaceae bacterium]MBN2707645.1 SDR family NAD(P)-dependent oxidoreductase [Calditrichaceae bacterium]RQV93185.1 MAG: SDR family NAD(P)-dependent oxidoreductase [Calditrichota bacterium]
MNEICVITGAGSGIGRALAIHLAREKHLKILGAGRRIENLEETKMMNPDKISVIKADVGTCDGRRRIFDAIPEDTRVRFLIHNAAVLEPVKPLIEFTLDEWRYHQAVNVEGPLFLTQKLLPKIKKKARILHISSGAAHHSYAGWGAYCASKAALFSIYEVLREELRTKNILIGSVRPGIVDTPMQDKVRSYPETVFPMLKKFEKLKNDRQLIAPDQVAEFITCLLLDTPDEEYIGQEWDFREH